MEVVYPCCCGLDVHKKSITACVLWAEAKGKSRKEKRRFGTFTHDLLQLADWLGESGVTHVAMESTGVYWKPVWNILAEQFKVLLVNAQHIKAVPGRKTDQKDSEWIADLLQHGLLRGSFVPPQPTRELRDLTRYRVSLAQEINRIANRIQKVLEDANIKLASVATDALGASGRAILEAMLAGERPLLSKIARYAKVNRSLEELLPKVPVHTPECEYLQGLIKHPPDHYDKMVSSLKPMLSKLDTPDFRNLMSVTTPELDWDRAIRLKKIVYMFMGSMIVKETAYAIGMLALQDLLNFIGRAYAYEPTKTPIRLIVDEVGRLAFPGFVDLLSQAGGQGLMAVLAFQSVADLVSVLGPAGAQQILDNTNTKLWFRATDHATAKTFADIAGQGPLLTRRESAAYRPVVPGKPARNRLAFDATFAQQSTEVVENLVREDWLMKLPRGQAFLYASGQTYKTRFPLMPEPKNRFPLEAAA